MVSNTENRPEPTFQKQKYMWLRQRLPLDLLAIDEEIICMPSLVQEAGELTAEAIEIRERAKEDLERTIAEQAEALRAIPGPNGKYRSETAISTQVYLSPKVEASLSEYGASRLDAALWSTLVEALRRKDSSIRVVADLLNSGFLTTSSIIEKRHKDIRNAKVGA